MFEQQADGDSSKHLNKGTDTSTTVFLNTWKDGFCAILGGDLVVFGVCFLAETVRGDNYFDTFCYVYMLFLNKQRSIVVLS